MLDSKSYIRSRLASLRLSPAREAEIAEEIAQHLEDRWKEWRRFGHVRSKQDRETITGTYHGMYGRQMSRGPSNRTM